MPLAILVLTVIASLAAVLAFLAIPGQDKDLRDALGRLDQAVVNGDWSALYRAPAKAMLSAMEAIFGPRVFAWRYFLMVTLTSVVTTAALYLLSLTWTYLQLRATWTQCPVPGFAMFAEIPRFMLPLLVQILFVNALCDYVAWAASMWGLRYVARTRRRVSILVFLGVPAFAAVTLFLLYCVYLPIAIGTDFIQRGGSPQPGYFGQIIRANLGNIVHFFALPDPLIGLRCSTGTFGVSYIATMQYLALETLIPSILFVLMTAFGFVAVLTKPWTRPSISFLARTIKGHPLPVLVIVTSFLFGLEMILEKVKDYL